MSLFEITKKLTDIFSEVFSSKDKTRKSHTTKYRKLMIDPLEERQLLSLNSVLTLEQFVNQQHPTIITQSTSSLIGQSLSMPASLTQSLLEIPGYTYAKGNNTYYETPWSNESLAGNNQGDFVITWAQNDYVVNPEWTMYTYNYSDYVEGYLKAHPGVLEANIPIPDPFLKDSKGEYYNNWNVYARYYTDEVQRITLPVELTNNNVPIKGDTGIGRATLVYAPYEVQRLSLKTANEPFAFARGDMVGTFILGGIDINGDGILEWTQPISYNETDNPLISAERIRLALEELGGDFAGVTVTPLSGRDFDITFGESAMGKNMPEIQFRNINLTGFYAGGVITTVSEPILVTNYDIFGNSIGFVVDPNDPQVTANNIQAAMNGSIVRNPYALTIIAPGMEYANLSNTYTDYPDGPIFSIYQGPTVNVNLVRDANGQLLKNVFDITFVDGSGKIDHPELVIWSAVDENKVEYVGYDTDTYSVQTLKQPSQQFRVNEPEPNNPNAAVPVELNQLNPTVAMDADGDFVIAWQGEVRGSNNTITSNIYARRFTPQGIVDPLIIESSSSWFYTDGATSLQYQKDYYGDIVLDSNGKPIPLNTAVQGVRPTSNVFQVNSFTNGEQMQPAIGMDRDGNFIISWSNFRQTNSYFTGIYAKWYDRDGNALTTDISISSQSGISEFLPLIHSSVTLSNDGYAVFTWYDGVDANTDALILLTRAHYQVYAPNDHVNPIATGIIGGDGDTCAINAHVAFDWNNRFLITYTRNYPFGSGDIQLSDAYAEVYVINPVDNTVIKATDSFRVTARDVWTGSDWTWPAAQLNTVGGFDADGDMVFAYQGYGPDFSMNNLFNLSMSSYNNAVAYLRGLINSNNNSDLLDFFNPAYDVVPMEWSPIPYSGFDVSLLLGNPSNLGAVDVDFAIRYYLIIAQKRRNSSGQLATPDQLGRLNAILETVYGPLRGSANDIMTTSFNNGNASFGVANSSDAIVSSVRDGENYRFYISVPYFPSIDPDDPNGNGTIAGGNINLRWWRYSETNGIITSSGSMDMTLPLVFTNSNFDPYETLNAWNAWDGPLCSFGLFAPSTDREHPVNNSISPAAVTLLTPVNYYSSLLGPFGGPLQLELNARAGTPWALPSYLLSDGSMGYWVYEVVLQGGAHDTSFDFSYLNGTSLTIKGTQGNFSGYYDITVENYGNPGTEQLTPGIHVLPNGSYVVSWVSDVRSTSGQLIDRNINFRYIKEDQDNAGPIVTDLILPNGERLANNGMVTSAVKQMVVTFDEEVNAVSNPRDPNYVHSVLNPNNWAILKNGVEIAGMITNISFGMSRSRDLATTGTLSYGSNKWEAVIEFDGNGFANGDIPLGDGSYELILKKSVTDVAGNALGRQGLNPNGSDFSRKFTISVIDGILEFGKDPNSEGNNYEDKQVNIEIQPGDQNTRDEYGLDTPSNPQSVASDAEGNFVAVWTGPDGIWAKIYRQTFTMDDYGNRVSDGGVGVFEFKVTDNPNDYYASVAMDADGDFVITWVRSSTITDAKGKVVNSKDIYAKAFNANGTERTKMKYDGSVVSIGEFRVNSEMGGLQNYPKIAMDFKGDFVITWESFRQEENSYNYSYEIFYQRYDAACNPLGTIDEIQMIQFLNRPSPGTKFKLEFYGVKTELIEIKQNDYETAIEIKNKLEKLTINGMQLKVEVEAGSAGRIYIQFIGEWSGMDVPQINVVNTQTDPIIWVDKKTNQAIMSSTMVDGASGELRANETTLGDQRYPSIAMGPLGDFIITWTSKGQGADSPIETNIYARNFPSNDSIRSQVAQTSLAEKLDASKPKPTPEDPQSDLPYQPMIVTADNPANHVITPNSGEYTGVVLVTINLGNGMVGYGSGTLLTSGFHILTAGHVVSDDFGNPFNPAQVTVTFHLASGTVTIGASEIFVHQSYDGNYIGTADIAIIRLSEAAPRAAQRYDIYRGSGEIGSVVTKVGYGTTGTGTLGGDTFDLLKRSGQNRYDASGSIFGTIYTDDYFTPATLACDFDDGTDAHDAFGQVFGIKDTGLGNDEVSTAPGDSGGPGFITDFSGRQLIAGVTSYGIIVAGSHDVNPGLNSSFGDFFVDVQVSEYAGWIDSIVSNASPEYLVNETEKGNQIWSDVAISATGEVIFTWTSYGQDGGGDGPGYFVDGQAGVYARRFNLDGMPANVYNPVTGEYEAAHEFLVNDYVVGNQYYSSIAAAANGDFIITWESFQDHPKTDSGFADANSTTYGIYAKRYVNTATLNKAMLDLSILGPPRYGLPDYTYYIPGYGNVGFSGEIGREIHVNKNQVEGDQTGTTVAVNYNGDAVIVFQSDRLDSNKDIDKDNPRDVFYRVLPLQKDQTGPIVTDVVAVVDTTVYRKDANGNLIRDVDGYPIPETDGSGKIVRATELVGVANGTVLDGLVHQMVITFSEEMLDSFGGRNSKYITDISNWTLSRNGVPIMGLISNIEFGYNLTHTNGIIDPNAPATGKWEAIITFDGNANPSDGDQPLLTGFYQLTIKDNVTDLAGNKLDGNYDGRPGGNFTRTFYVFSDPNEIGGDDDNDPTWDPTDPSLPNPKVPDSEAFRTTLFDQNQPAIASREDGSFVIVAVDYGREAMYAKTNEKIEGIGTIGMLYEGYGDIIMRRYDKYGNPNGNDIVVNAAPGYQYGDQTSPAVAVDKYGNTAVVWCGRGPAIESGVFCRIYDAYGMPVDGIFQVNIGYDGEHFAPKVAFDGQGNIVVTWLQYDNDTRGDVICARVVSAYGPISGTPSDPKRSDIVIASSYGVSIREYDLAMDDSQHLVLTWRMYDSTTKTDDIFAKVMTLNVNPVTYTVSFTTNVNNFRVNTHTPNSQITPKVAISNNGTFVITWASEYQETGKPEDQLGVYARRFALNGTALPILGKTTDAQINVVTKGNQFLPGVSMAPNGNFVITWTTFDQEGQNYDPEEGMIVKDYSVMVRAFNSSGNDLEGETNYYRQGSSKEHRVNGTIIGDQMNSVVTMNNDGFAVAWVGPGAIYPEMIPDPDTEGEFIIFLEHTTDIWYRVYRSGSNMGRPASTKTSTMTTTNKSYGSSYAGLAPGAYSSSNLEYATIVGTEGNDVIEVTVGANGIITVVINKESRTLASTVKTVYFQGLGGNDTIIINGTKVNDVAVFNADDKYVSLSANDGAYKFVATDFETVTINGAAGQNTLSVVTAKTGNKLEISPGQLILSGGGLRYTANGFQNVSANSSSSTDQVYLYDSAGDDHVEMLPGEVIMTGSGFRHAVYGFRNVTAYSTKGNDTIKMYGTADGTNSLLSTATTTSLISGSVRNVAKGFKDVVVYGKGGSNQAMFLGTQFNDTYSGSVDCSAMYFGGYYTSVTTFGFQKVTVDGNGGYNKATISGAARGNSLTVSDDGSKAVLSALQYSQTLKNFSSVTVLGSSGDTATVTTSSRGKVVQSDDTVYQFLIDDLELYRLIAFDHVKAKNSSGAEIPIEKTTEYLLKTGALKK